MDFLGIIKFKHPLGDQHKISFICVWGNFTYKKIPFGIKNVGVTFQWDMSYSFLDIKKIIGAYVDDLATHSKES